MSSGAVPLDPVIHAQARLRIMATLAGLPRGDEMVSTHLSRLEEAGYVSQSKTFTGRTPATYLALTTRGRAAFEEYTRALREMLDAVGT